LKRDDSKEENVHIATLQEKQCVGENAIMSQGECKPRGASIVAKTDCLVLILMKETYD